MAIPFLPAKVLAVQGKDPSRAFARREGHHFTWQWSGFHHSQGMKYKMFTLPRVPAGTESSDYPAGAARPGGWSPPISGCTPETGIQQSCNQQDIVR